MARTERIDLAHVPGFRLGVLTVEPPLHRVVRDDGADELLQHRVMQVLVALARAQGEILTRDELTMSCWDGRVVGEDAINRILSRLRAVATGIGADSFRIETITRVGYRLLREGQTAAIMPETGVAPEAPPRRLDRRLILAGGAAVLGAAAAGGWLFWPRGGHAPDGAPPADVAPLMVQAMIALRQESPEGVDQAIGPLRQVVARRPDFADGWGALGLAYSWTYLSRNAQSDPGLEQRARAAIARAAGLDPNNGYAALATCALMVPFGTWGRREQILRAAVRYHPDNDLLLAVLGILMASVGRSREAVDLLARALALAPTSSSTHFYYILTLWSSNRLEETDRALDQAAALFPGNAGIWFSRLYIYLFSGRARQAIAFLGDTDGRPRGVAPVDFDDLLIIARALESRATADVDAAMRLVVASAHQAVGRAETGIQFASAFGRLDDAFAIAAALYFQRGFDPGEVRFNRQEGVYTRRSNRRTNMLFLPSTAAMRADPRFATLVGEIGLPHYWAEAGVRPDYQVA